MNDSQIVPTSRKRSISSSERRTRLRLRELCDEVLASYRVATGSDPIPQSDREMARMLFPIG